MISKEELTKVPMEKRVDYLVSKRPGPIEDSTSNHYGLFLEHIDLNHTFNNQLSGKVVINDKMIKTDEDREELQRKIYRITEGSSLESYPSCECGETKYTHNLTKDTGLNCKYCGTPVVYTSEVPLESNTWIGVPDGVKAFFNPSVFHNINEVFSSKSKQNINPLRYLLDPTSYRGHLITAKDEIGLKVRQAVDDGRLVRDYNWVVDNLDTIMATLHQFYKDSKSKLPKLDLLMEYYHFVRAQDVIFTQYLPLPNNSIVIWEKEDSGHSRMTRSSGLLKEAINQMNRVIRTPNGDGIEKSNSKDKKRLRWKAQAASTRMQFTFQEYFTTLYRHEIGKKHGLARSDTFGVRPPFTWRNVITAINGPHAIDEIHMPWTSAIAVLEPLILNKLYKSGCSEREAKDFIAKYTRVYSPVLDNIFKEIISESPFKGLPVSYIRNPHLYVLSNQTMFITKVKVDVDDRTTSVPNGALPGWNGD